MRDGNIITEPTDIANIFNHFYTDLTNNSNLYDKNTSNLTSNNINNYNIIKNNNSIFLNPTTSSDILKVIISLKNTHSTGYDDINTKVVKYVMLVISPIICHIINKFPNELKTAIIKPLYKKEDKLNINNYRPVALLPIFAKIFEKIMYKNISSAWCQNVWNKDNLFPSGSRLRLSYF